MKKEWTGERLETFILSGDTIEHLHRYAIASGYVHNKIVLDIASGEGYGSNLLSKYAKTVTGVDIDNTAVVLAKKKYKKDNLIYKQGSTSAIPLGNASVDVVVSFETIEHHDEHELMMREIKRVLKPDGMLIISTPDKLFYSDKKNFKNQFHVKELYRDEFKTLISESFKKVQILEQKYISGVSMIFDEKYQNDYVFYTGNYNEINSLEVNPLYLVAIAADVDFKEQGKSIFDGSDIEKSGIFQNIFDSNTYKVGNFILKPLKYLKKISKK